MRRILGSLGPFGPLVPIIGGMVLISCVFPWRAYHEVEQMNQEIEWARNNPTSVRNPFNGVGAVAHPGIPADRATDLQRPDECDCKDE